MQGKEAGLTAALLQSLRWRLDKAAVASDRCQVLASYIENDILMLRRVRLITQHVKSERSMLLQASHTYTVWFWCPDMLQLASKGVHAVMYGCIIGRCMAKYASTGVQTGPVLLF